MSNRAAARSAQGKNAPAAVAVEQESAPLAAAEPLTATSMPAPAGDGDTGPGTGTPSPADTLQRMQDRQHTRLTANAAPITAPDAALQDAPFEGLANSSTNPIAKTAGIPGGMPGDNSIRLIRADTGAVITDGTTIFNAQVGDQTFVTTRWRVEEEFAYMGAPTAPMRRLLFAAGQKVPLYASTRLVAAMADALEQRQQIVP